MKLTALALALGLGCAVAAPVVLVHPTVAHAADKKVEQLLLERNAARAGRIAAGLLEQAAKPAPADLGPKQKESFALQSTRLQSSAAEFTAQEKAIRALLASQGPTAEAMAAMNTQFLSLTNATLTMLRPLALTSAAAQARHDVVNVLCTNEN